MSVQNRDTLFSNFNAIANAENPTEATTTFLEDLADTLQDYERRVSGTEDWEKKYKENDEAWRKRYNERFYAPVEEKPAPAPAEAVRINDLFEEVK